MSSKSKDVRIEQRRILEKKLDLRLQQLAQKGISKEKAPSDPLVKKLKARIRETNIRIAVADKFVQRTQELVQAKAQKLAELAKKEKEPESAPGAASAEPKHKKQSAAPAKAESKKKPATDEKETKPKKKTVAADKEPEKQQSAASEVEPPKRPRKKKEETKAE